MAYGDSNWRFSEHEIRAKLEELGYHNLPDKALKEFSSDLHELIAVENRKKGVVVREDLPSTASSLNSSTSTISSSELSETHDEEPAEYEMGHQYRETLKEDGNYQNIPTYRDKYQTQLDHDHLLPQSHEYNVSGKENQTERNLDTSIRLAQKRKVLRHKDGKARVFDESFTNDISATDISDLEESLQRLPLKDKVDIDNVSIYSNQSEGSTAWQHLGRNRNVLPSFIRTKQGDHGTQGIKRTDPVNRYHQFKEEWRNKKVPGEKTHKNLRWATRAQMLQHETFEKPRHRYTPNNYVAPTDKKRQALRWEVRSTLANT